MVQLMGRPATSVPYEDDVSGAIVEAVLAVSGDSLDEIGPLYDDIDPEALNQLFAPTEDGRYRQVGPVQFRFEGFTVVIDTGPREVHIYE